MCGQLAQGENTSLMIGTVPGATDARHESQLSGVP